MPTPDLPGSEYPSWFTFLGSKNGFRKPVAQASSGGVLSASPGETRLSDPLWDEANEAFGRLRKAVQRREAQIRNAPLATISKSVSRWLCASASPNSVTVEATAFVRGARSRRNKKL